MDDKKKYNYNFASNGQPIYDFSFLESYSPEEQQEMAGAGNDDDNLLEAAYHGLVGATGNLTRTVGHMLNYAGKPARMTDEEWAEKNRKQGGLIASAVDLNKSVEDYGKGVEDAHARRYSDPLGANSIANAVGSVVPYAVGLGLSARVMGPNAVEQFNAEQGALAMSTRLAPYLDKLAGKYGAEVAAAAPKYMAPVLANLTTGTKQAFGESLLESFSSGKMDYIEKAKANKTYVPGVTEIEAEKVAKGVLADNLMFITGTDTLQDALMMISGKGKAGTAMKLLAASGINAGQEVGQQIFPKAEAGEKWSFSDPDVILSGIAGAITGGVPHAVGATYDHFYPNNADDISSVETGDTEITQNATAHEDADREAFINAIAGQESGGNYSAVNARTGASGKYQIMPENWPAWAEEAGLGADAEMTPENQEIVARFKLGQYYDKYGARGAAVAWYGGEGALSYGEEALNRKQGEGNEPSINEYADSIMSRMGQGNEQGRSGPSRKEAKSFLQQYLENEAEAGDEYNGIEDLLATGSDEDVIAKAIELGYGREETPQQPATQQASTEGSEPLKAAIDGVNKTIEVVNANGGQPTFGGLNTAIQTIGGPSSVADSDTQTVTATPNVNDNIVINNGQPITQGQVDSNINTNTETQSSNTGLTVAPNKKTEDKILNLRKGLTRLADNKGDKKRRLTDEEVAELRDAAESDDLGKVISTARKYGYRIGRDIEDEAKRRDGERRSSLTGDAWSNEEINATAKDLKGNVKARYTDKVNGEPDWAKINKSKKAQAVLNDSNYDNLGTRAIDGDVEAREKLNSLDPLQKLALLDRARKAKAGQGQDIAHPEVASSTVDTHESVPKGDEESSAGAKETNNVAEDEIRDVDGWRYNIGNYHQTISQDGDSDVRSYMRDNDAGQSKQGWDRFTVERSSDTDFTITFNAGGPSGVFFANSMAEVEKIVAETDGINVADKQDGNKSAEGNRVKETQEEQNGGEKNEDKNGEGSTESEQNSVQDEQSEAVEQGETNDNQDKGDDSEVEEVGDKSDEEGDKAEKSEEEEFQKPYYANYSQEEYDNLLQLIKECNKEFGTHFEVKGPWLFDPDKQLKFRFDQFTAATWLSFSRDVAFQNINDMVNLFGEPLKENSTSSGEQASTNTKENDTDGENAENDVADKDIDDEIKKQELEKQAEAEQEKFDDVEGMITKISEKRSGDNDKVIKSVVKYLRTHWEEAELLFDILKKNPRLLYSAVKDSKSQSGLRKVYYVVWDGQEKPKKISKAFFQGLVIAQSQSAFLSKRAFETAEEEATTLETYKKEQELATKAKKDEAEEDGNDKYIKEIPEDSAYDFIDEVEEELGKEAAKEADDILNQDSPYTDANGNPMTWGEKIRELAFKCLQAEDTLIFENFCKENGWGNSISEEGRSEADPYKDFFWYLYDNFEGRVKPTARGGYKTDGDAAMELSFRISSALGKHKSNIFFEDREIIPRVRDLLAKRFPDTPFDEIKDKDIESAVGDVMRLEYAKEAKRLLDEYDKLTKAAKEAREAFWKKSDELSAAHSKYQSALKKLQEAIKKIDEAIKKRQPREVQLKLEEEAALAQREVDEIGDDPYYNDEEKRIERELKSRKSNAEIDLKKWEKKYGDRLLKLKNLVTNNDSEVEAAFEALSKTRDLPSASRDSARREAFEKYEEAQRAAIERVLQEGVIEAATENAAEQIKTAEQTEAVEQGKEEQAEKLDDDLVDSFADVLNAWGDAAFKAEEKDNQELAHYEPGVFSQFLMLGANLLTKRFNRAVATFEAWKNLAMQYISAGLSKAVEAGKKTAIQANELKNFASAALRSCWEFLHSVPESVELKADAAEAGKWKQALSAVRNAMGKGIKPSELKKMLSERSPALYEQIKDFIDPAYKALRKYPRQGDESVVDLNNDDNGGGTDESIRTPREPNQGNRGRGNENGVEGESGTQVRNGSQTGEADNLSAGQNPSRQGSAGEGGNRSENVSGSGAAAGRERGNNQGGDKTSNATERSSGNSNQTGSNRTGESGIPVHGPNNSESSRTSPSRHAGGKTPTDDAAERLKQQQAIKDDTPVKAANEANIAETLPLLYPPQHKDIQAIEKRLYASDKPGMLVANGTGTGKTLTALGVIKRLLMQGKTKILIIVPGQDIANDAWRGDGKLLGIESFAYLGNGAVVEGVPNIISYSSLATNKSVQETDWDLIVCDEAHHIASGANRTDANRLQDQGIYTRAFRGLFGHKTGGLDGYMRIKYSELYKEGEELQERLKELGDYLENAAPTQELSPKQQAELAKIKQELAKGEARIKEIRKKLAELARKEKPLYDKRKSDASTKVLLLSATPFAYPQNAYYAEGLLFNYSEPDFGGSPRGMLTRLFRFTIAASGKIVAPRDANGELIDTTPNEIKFHDLLVKAGALINRRLDSDKDYNRRFIKVKAENTVAEKRLHELAKMLCAFSNGSTKSKKEILAGEQDSPASESFAKWWMDTKLKNALEFLLETEKAEASIPVIKSYLERGKKVVLYHDWKESSITKPLKLTKAEISRLTHEQKQEYEKFKKQFPEYADMDLSEDLSAIRIIQKAFGKKAAFVNGSESKTNRKNAVKTFNDDNSGVDIIMVTSAAGQEGISMHDKTGKHPRVLINLGLPIRPTAAIQIEGRIYRFGAKSNAMFRYLITGSAEEQEAFYSKIASRSKTAENMALGADARALDIAFQSGFTQASMEEVGDFDYTKDEASDGGKAQDSRSRKEAFNDLYSTLSESDIPSFKAVAERLRQREEADAAETERQEIVTEDNERNFVAKLKEALHSKKVATVAPGVYVVELANGNNLWIDSNGSQAAILGRMSYEQKKRMLSAADIKNSGFVIQGYYAKENLDEAGGIVDLIRLTEAAKDETLYHEVMHFVHRTLLTPSEQEHLARYYKYKLKQKIGAEKFSKLSEKEIMARCEEMECDDYAAFIKEDKRPKNIGQRLVWKMQKWLAGLVEKFGVHTDMGIYLAIRSGKVFERQGKTDNKTVGAKYQAVGQKAKTADKLKLSHAQEMQREGKSREEIFDETGWWQGKDKQWRFEIKDDPNDIDLGAFEREGDDRLPLKALYHNEALFKAYPQLANLEVRLEGTNDNYSGYANGSKIVIADYDEYAQEKNELIKFYKAITQFALEEGELANTSFATAKAAPLMVERTLQNFFEYHEKSLPSNFLRWFSDNFPESLLEELNDRVEECRSLEQNAKGTLFHELQHIIQRIENFARGGNVEEVDGDFDRYMIGHGEQEARAAAVRALGSGYLNSPYVQLESHEYPWQDLFFEDAAEVTFYDQPALEPAFSVTPKDDGTVDIKVTPVEKIDGKKFPDNLKAVLDAANKEADEAGVKKGEIKTKFNKMTDKAKDAVGGIVDATLRSPSRLAEKNPVFKSFYTIYAKAQETQEKLRSRWRKQFQTFVSLLNSNEQFDDYLDLLQSGEMEQKEYTIKELQDAGYDRPTIEAYARTRQLIRNVWEAVNDAHRGLTHIKEEVDGKALKSLKSEPFLENLEVSVPKDMSNPKVGRQWVSVDKVTKILVGRKYEVRYDKPRVYTTSAKEQLTAEQLKELQNSPYAVVSAVTEKRLGEHGPVYYEAKVKRVAPPIGKITGYLPHIFEQWMVLAETKDGLVPVGSGKNLKEAYNVAKNLQTNGGEKISFQIAPKFFDPSRHLGDENDSVGGKKSSLIVSDEEYIALQRALVDNCKMSVAEAREALKGSVGRTNRNRFFGNIRQRKGRVGYNSNIINSLDRYFTMSSRYCALQPAKQKSIKLFERTFGRWDKEYGGKEAMANIIKRYIRHNNGTPNYLESMINSMIAKNDWLLKNLNANYGDRLGVALAGNINGFLSKNLLGFLNISSALVGLTQIANTAALIGFKYTGRGMVAAKALSMTDKRVLAEVGVPYNIGLDTPSGFSKRRSAIEGQKKGFKQLRSMLSKAGDKGMYLFKKADEVTRAVATLGAYYEAVESKGMTHKQAIAYAKQVNREANFDYGSSDAPGIFQMLSGTVVGDLALLFQKYPMKEWELMSSLLPYFGKGSKAQKARFWATYLLMSGFAGLPGGDWLDEFLENILGYKPSSVLKLELFKHLGDNPVSRTLVYGIFSNLGVDISRRVGMSGMFLDSDSLLGYLTGPAGSVIPGTIANAMSGEYIKATKTINPALGNVAEALRGYSTNKKGQVSYKYEGTEKYLKAMGFRPVGQSLAADMASGTYAEKTRAKDKKQKLLMEAARKRADGETLTTEEMTNLRQNGITGEQLRNAVNDLTLTTSERAKKYMTKQQKKDFADIPTMGKN